MTALSSALLAGALLLSPAAIAAQDAPAAAPASSPGGASDATPPSSQVPPVEAPPELKATDAEKVKRAIVKLKNDSEKHRVLAEKEVVAFGRGTLPLLEAAATTTNASMMTGIVNCMCGVADARDRDRVATCRTSPLPTLRRFAARASGDLGLAELLDQLAPLLEDADDVTKVETALALVRNGREDGLAVCTLAFGGKYGEGWRERVLAALPGVADKGPHLPVAKLLEIDPEREKLEPDVASNERVAAVQLLHQIRDGASKSLLVRALDDRHNVVQREAINALRDLLEGQGPMAASSIFQQLKEVERLKGVAKEKTGS